MKKLFLTVLAVIFGVFGCATQAVPQQPKSDPGPTLVQIPSASAAPCVDGAAESAPVKTQNLPVLPPNTYEVTLRCDFKKAVEAGKYSQIDEPLPQMKLLAENCQEGARVRVRLFQFDSGVTSEEAIVKMGKAGYYPSKWPRLLALGAEHPDLQRRWSIVALGSALRTPNLFALLVLNAVEGKRALSPYAEIPNFKWNPKNRFIGSRK